MADPVSVTLSAPVWAHGSQHTVLTFREPTGKELRLCGYPVSVAGDGKIDTDAVHKLMSATASVPTSTIDMLSARDWQSCMAAIIGFLGPVPETSSSDGSTAPAGGASPTTSGT